MAVETETRSYFNDANIPTILEVDPETGKSELYYYESSNIKRLAAEANLEDGSEWEVKRRFRTRYNRLTGSDLDKQEFETKFENEVRRRINRDRANIINNNSSNNVRKNLSKILPKVKDPDNNTTINDTTETPSEGSIVNNEANGNGVSSSNASSENASENNLNVPLKNDGGFAFLSEGDESQTPATQSLEYPLGMRGYGPDKPDRLKIDIYEYNPKALPTISGDGQQEPDTDTSKKEVTILLPIPQGVQDGNIVGWGKGDMNAAEAALGEFALSGMSRGVEGAKEAAQNILNDIDTVNGEAKTAIAGILAGNAINKGSQVLSRSTGAIINPNTELLFDGPSLRTFSFQYKFSPREPAEAKRIFDIIKCLKKGMAVRKSESTLFLMTPRIFKLTYKEGTTGNSHKYLNRFKDCALTQLTVNYAPNQTYMAYKDETGSVPVSFDVSMLFQELSPIFSDDYNNNESIGF